MQKSAQGKKGAIVTTASRGMCAGCARKLAVPPGEATQVVPMYASGEVVDLARYLGGVRLAGSVIEEAHLRALVDRTMRVFGRLGAVANNTGHPALSELPAMARRGGSTIVDDSRFSTFELSARFPVSLALRAALGSVAKPYADRYAGDGVRTNNDLPGSVDSSRTRRPAVRYPAGRRATVAEVARTMA